MLQTYKTTTTFPRRPSYTQPTNNIMSGRHNNGGSRYNNGNNNNSESKFCAVCSSAGRPDFNTHYVRADKFDRNSPITCPYLLSIQCRICGANGHTASYCKLNKSSDAGAAAPATRPDSRPSRLPPISSKQQHAPPRIVFETKPKTEQINFESAFPPLQSGKQRSTLPPLILPLSRVQSVRNDEPLMRRGPPEASPVHLPAPKKVAYNKKGNPFAALANSSDSDSDDYYSPVCAASSPEGVGRCRKSSGASWASVVTASPVHLPRFAPRQLSPLAAPLPPPMFKARENAKPRDKKKLWGDSDSEDDEAFLKRGFE